MQSVLGLTIKWNRRVKWDRSEWSIERLKVSKSWVAMIWRDLFHSKPGSTWKEPDPMFKVTKWGTHLLKAESKRRVVWKSGSIGRSTADQSSDIIWYWKEYSGYRSRDTRNTSEGLWTPELVGYRARVGRAFYRLNLLSQSLYDLDCPIYSTFVLVFRE